MSPDEVLICSTCRQEARVVRVGKSLLVLGHRTNPRQHHHPVTLSRSAEERDRLARGRSTSPRQSRVREDVPHLTTTGTRPASKGSAPDRLSSGAPSGARGA